MVPIKVTRNKTTLTENCQTDSVGEPKFSLLQSSRVAAPNNPTTAGRNPVKIDLTVRVFIYFINILLMSIIRMSEGSTRAKVAVALPNTAIRPL